MLFKQLNKTRLTFYLAPRVPEPDFDNVDFEDDGFEDDNDEVFNENGEELDQD